MKHARLMAIGLLLMMSVVMIHSVRQDTVTTDENLMIGVGHLLLTERYFKVGFEHPPLIRDLVAAPLAFMDLKPASEFLRERPAHQNLSDFAFNFGENFLLRQTHPPEDILFAARLPAILVALSLGLLLFHTTALYFGARAALFATLLYVSSPFFLAHGRLTTMDVPSALAVLAALWGFLRLLHEPRPRQAVLLGLILGAALLVKFPMVSLIPFLTVLYIFASVQRHVHPRVIWRHFLLVAVISFALLYVTYWYHLIGYPHAEHLSDIQSNIQSSRADVAEKMTWILHLAEYEALRPLAHYFYGLYWQMLRTGVFGYYFGEGSFSSWPSYYLFGLFSKNPEPLIVIWFVITMMGLWRWHGAWRAHGLRLTQIRAWLSPSSMRGWATLCFLLWIVFYLVILIFFNAGNSGTRYLIPVLPPLMILTGAALSALWDFGAGRSRILVRGGLAILITLQMISVFRVHPSYLSYFTLYLGGPTQASTYLIDTDVEWGQDIQRLAQWVETQGIQSIQVATGFEYIPVGGAPVPFYFSDSVYRHYLGDRYQAYSPQHQTNGWLAVPGRILKWGQARPATKSGWYSESFRFLENREPVTVIGGSIWVFEL
ncbi:MAG: glycosyltransferase family 39 protein [Bdellovibrionaceae bacterium]|nr:glycosyltransferase family 39 protein [Pseudobdellovibrionaceae bacterium]